MNRAADPFAPAVLRAVPESLGESNVLERANLFAKPVLAIDIGTHLGWALRTSTCVTSGTLNLAERARETRGDRLLRLWRWLHRIQTATPLALLAYELVQHMGTNQRLAAHCYAQFQAVVLTFAARHQIPVKEVHTGTLKKAIAGRGSFPKGQAKEAVKAAIIARGYTPDTYDEADALAVLEWATQ